MFEFFTTIFFIWLFIKGIGLVFRLTWGVAKILAGLLMVLALPLLVVCLIFTGGLILLIPVAMVGLAIGILKIRT